jgi:glycosyltransferase involved in cell wall biosynthesis
VTAAIHIGISLGQIGRFDDGLGEFSHQLCSRLAAQAPALREAHGIELWFHMRERLFGRFGSDVHYLPISKWQRYRHVQPVTFAIWHSLNQLNKTLPPQGTQHRVVTVHDLNFFYFKNRFSQWRDLRRTRRLLARTDELVAITDYVRGDVVQRLQWVGPISTIHNGASNLTGVAREPCAGLDSGGFLFHLSRMSPSKNIPALLALAAVWPEQVFVLAGPASEASRAVQAEVAARALTNVKVLMDLSEGQKAWLFANCRAFLFPSITEGFGLPPIEAMHFGKPVFLSRLTSLPEVGGDAAFYFDHFDPAAMRRAVEAGLARAADSGHSAAVRVQAARFDWDDTAAAYVDLYRSQLGLAASG